MHLLLIASPYFHIIIGTTIHITIAVPARTAFPHAMPNLSYNAGANNGKLNPAIVLTKAAAPVALAAYRSYESIMYVCAHWNERIRPMAKIAAPTLGIIQWSLKCAEMP